MHVCNIGVNVTGVYMAEVCVCIRHLCIRCLCDSLVCVNVFQQCVYVCVCEKWRGNNGF